ncbi:MAG: glycogen/starch synthase [Candidatus Woesearchaeota archaeon]
MTDERVVVEVAWEVANKVGGIHTVVSTKAASLTQRFKNYLCVGPLFAQKKLENVTEHPPPSELAVVLDDLRLRGIHCLYGTWDIPGSPRVLLLDASSADLDWDGMKASYWQDFGVDTLRAEWDVLEPLRWASACGLFLDLYQQRLGVRVLAQFHEWMAGFGVLYCKQHNAQVKTIFTTHATVLGRSLSSSTNEDIYSLIESVDIDAQARELGVFEKHSSEKAAALACDVFTTVSEITSLEASYVLSRSPDVILPNGLVSESDSERSVLHRVSRERLRDFVYAYFFGHHQFDLDETLLFFTNGRYEFHNKGLDVLTDALGVLNRRLREANHKKRVVVFYCIPSDSHNIKEDVLQSQRAFSSLRLFVDEHVDDLKRRLLRSALRIGSLSSDEILDDSVREQISSLAQQLVRSRPPSVCTHHLPGESSDDLVRFFSRNELTNSADDWVKVIRLPVYLDGADGLLNLSMQEVGSGCHLGLFVSYYEPWGYTPLESATWGTPAITTDLAGFGRFVREHASSQQGVVVLDRHKKSYEDVVSSLASAMFSFVELSQDERRLRREEALGVSSLAQWSEFIKHYFSAFDLAYEK